MSGKTITAKSGDSFGGRLSVQLKGLWRDIKVNRNVYMMVLPILAYYIIFKYVPMYGIQIAFKDYKLLAGISGSDWAQPIFKYFIKFVDSRYFIRVMRNTFLLSAYGLIWAFPAPILLAMLLNEIEAAWFRRTVQTITYMPHFISIMVICGMITMFCQSDGLFNDIIRIFNPAYEGKNLLSNPSYFRTIYIGSGIWRSIGWDSILYIAAILGIDQAQYEAAVIDGAGKFAQAFYITLPGILPTIIIKLIFRVGDMMDIGFEKVFLLYNEATWKVSDVIATYSYRVGLLDNNYSYSTAISFFSTIINLFFLLGANFLARKFSETSLF